MFFFVFDFHRGHGTYSVDNHLYAAICGVVERVNQLVSVVPLKSRYQGHVGDVVVGRIVEVGNKRWKVDVNSFQSAVLLLSAVTLPGDAQRRRTYEDQLNMRSMYAEGDLISAEVQQFYQQDGSMALQTRSSRYGRLGHGVLVEVQPHLVKRCKQHFHSFTALGVDMILGLNGYVWLSPASTVTDETAGRESVCRVRNAILALASSFILVSPETIQDVYEDSVEMSLSVDAMLDPSHFQSLTARASVRKLDL